MTADLFGNPEMKAVMDAAMPSPLGYAEPEAIASVLAFLVSEEAAHVTGQLLFVDSGADATTRPDIAI
jgi:NAD(P)-dependent dehydrogenase (short-subunit alcohol dehydrogenase family)